MLKRGIKEWIVRSVIPGSLITHGRTHMAVCLIIIFILLFVDRSYIKIGCRNWA